MSKQMNKYIKKHLSHYLCVYRSGFNPQYALVAVVEKLKCFDEGGILMDDMTNRELMIAKVEAYDFGEDT